MCRDQFGARDSWLNNWEHRGEDMYCPRALLKLPGSGTTFFFFALRTALSCRICQAANTHRVCSVSLPDGQVFDAQAPRRIFCSPHISERDAKPNRQAGWLMLRNWCPMPCLRDNHSHRECTDFPQSLTAIDFSISQNLFRFLVSGSESDETSPESALLATGREKNHMGGDVTCLLVKVEWGGGGGQFLGLSVCSRLQPSCGIHSPASACRGFTSGEVWMALST